MVFSLESLRQRIIEILEAGKKIKLLIDSPGGDATGVAETADLIYANRDKIDSFIEGYGASAAYWLAAAAGNVMASTSAIVGSVGVASVLIDESQAYEKIGIRIKQMQSKQSPLKRGTLDDSEYVEMIQTKLDDLADLFISALAKYRKKDKMYVEENFGKGGVLVAQKANEAGMVDGIFNFLEKNSLTSYVSSIKEVTMDNEEKKLEHLRQQVEQARVESEKIYQENKILQEKIDDANRKEKSQSFFSFAQMTLSVR